MRTLLVAAVRGYAVDRVERIAPSLCVILLLASCTPSAQDGGFESPNPASRLYAIEDAVRQHDRAAIPHLIESLDADDPAVRMLAITALTRMTGRTYGYRYYDAVWTRREAIARWSDAFSSGALTGEPIEPDDAASRWPASEPDANE